MAYRVHLEDIGQWSVAAGAIIEDAFVYLFGGLVLYPVYIRGLTQLENTNQEKQFMMVFAKCHLTMTLHRKDQILLNAHYLNSST